MELRTEKLNEKILVVHIMGRFDAHSASEVKALWQQDENIISIAADLSGTAFIDSTALAALISGMKTARQRGGDFVVANPSDVVKLIFDLTQMHKAFEIVDTLDEAVALLQK